MAVADQAVRIADQTLELLMRQLGLPNCTCFYRLRSDLPNMPINCETVGEAVLTLLKIYQLYIALTQLTRSHSSNAGLVKRMLIAYVTLADNIVSVNLAL